MSFTLPAEWHSQSAIMLTWPHQDTDWNPILSDIERVYIELATHITHYQLLVLVCHNVALRQRVETLLADSDTNITNIRWCIAPCNDTWARDHGPITLINNSGETKIIDFTFNAWGAKYDANFDNEITSHLLNEPFCQASYTSTSSFILEGGSIESDGNGTLLTTSKCLLNENRNKHLSKAQIEAKLLTSLGMKQVLWLDYGYLAGDDTDAHIDTLARFCPNGIVYVQCTDDQDPHFDELQKMEAQLKRFKDANGFPYNLYPLPMAGPKRDDAGDSKGELLPATYANYLIINGAVLVPTYSDANDAVALDVIRKAHPERKVIGIDCNAVIKQFGSLHCLTMQIPSGVIK